MMSLPPNVLMYRAGMTPANQAIFDKLAEIAYEAEPGLQSAIKWRVPTFTVNANWHHWLFSMAQTKKGVTLNFHKGWLLADPSRSLLGGGKHLRQLVFTDVTQIQADTVAGFVGEALRHQLKRE